MCKGLLDNLAVDVVGVFRLVAVLVGDLGDATTLVVLVSVARAVGCGDGLDLACVVVVSERLGDAAAGDA